MRYPAPLPAGGTIGFVAPSFGIAMEPYQTAFASAVEKFRAMGYGLWFGPNVYKGDGIGRSTDAESCGRELNQAWETEDCQMLLACGGGELMCEDLPYIDWERMQAAPAKWYCGYSDNTNFTFLLATLADTASLYGPCAPAFGMEPWHPAIQDAFRLLTGQADTFQNYPLWERESLKDEDHPLVPYHVTEPFQLRYYNADGAAGVRLSGRLLGGCIDCLSNLVGTKYDQVQAFNDRYGEEGILWFLESCDLTPMSLRRAVWQMGEAGWFDRAAGFLVGRPWQYGAEQMGLAMDTALQPLMDTGLPVICDLDIGHLPPQMPMVSGGTAQFTAKGNRATITYTWE